jgi:hypothetical protein
MKLFRRGLLFLLVLAGIVVATGAVLHRHEKMAIFLEARDRIERGEDPMVALAITRKRIDWAPVSSHEAARIAGQAIGTVTGGFEIYRAGPWALVDGPARERRLVERVSAGWREVR